VTPEPEEQPDDTPITPAKDAVDYALAQSVKPEPRHHIQQRDEDGKATSPSKEASISEMREQVKAELRAEKELKDEESWFKAMEAVGITCAPKAFCLVFGAGAAVATLVWLIKHGTWQ